MKEKKRQMLEREKKKLSVQSWVGVCNATNQTINLWSFNFHFYKQTSQSPLVVWPHLIHFHVLNSK